MINIFNKTLFELNQKLRNQVNELHELCTELNEIKISKAPQVFNMVKEEGFMKNKSMK